MKDIDNRNRYLSVEQFALEHPAFSQSSLRHLIFDADRNGFRSVLRRVGKRKILLDEQSFFAWIEQQNQQGGK